MAVALVLLCLMPGVRSEGQTVMPQILTLNLKLPSPKSPGEGFRLNGTYQLNRELGPIRTVNRYPQPTVRQEYLVNPGMRFVPWQFNNLTLGMPGFTPMQRLAISVPWDWESAFEMRPLAPTKVRRSRSVREQ